MNQPFQQQPKPMMGVFAGTDELTGTVDMQKVEGMDLPSVDEQPPSLTGPEQNTGEGIHFLLELLHKIRLQFHRHRRDEAEAKCEADLARTTAAKKLESNSVKAGIAVVADVDQWVQTLTAEGNKHTIAMIAIVIESTSRQLKEFEDTSKCHPLIRDTAETAIMEDFRESIAAIRKGNGERGSREGGTTAFPVQPSVTVDQSDYDQDLPKWSD